jgi:hypothetical protein
LRIAWLAPLLLLTAAAVGAERSELAARMSKADSASEYWDLTARFESGHRLMARFLVTNQGPGEHTGVALGHLIFPDGSHKAFENARRRARWEIDAEGLRLEMGSSLLDLRGPERSYAIDKNRAGVKIRLSIQASPATSLASRSGPGGYSLRIIDVAAPIEGTVWVRDRGMPEPVAVRGRAALTHTWMKGAEAKLALRRIDFASLGDDAGISLVDLTTPDGGSLRWLAVHRDGRIVHETGDFELSLEGAVAGWKVARYPVPGALRFRDSRVDGSVELERIVLSHEPLELLPQPFRFLLSLEARPRRVWAESPFEVKFDPGSDRSSWQVRGTGIATVSFLNPLEP